MTTATGWRSEQYVKKMKTAKLRRYSNPIIATEVHVPEPGNHIGPGTDWVKQVMNVVIH